MNRKLNVSQAGYENPLFILSPSVGFSSHLDQSPVSCLLFLTLFEASLPHKVLRFSCNNLISLLNFICFPVFILFQVQDEPKEGNVDATMRDIFLKLPSDRSCTRFSKCYNI